MNESLVERARKLLKNWNEFHESGAADKRKLTRVGYQFWLKDLPDFLEAVLPVLEGKAVHAPLGASADYPQRRTLAKAQIAGQIVAMRPYDGQIVQWATQLAEEILKACEAKHE